MAFVYRSEKIPSHISSISNQQIGPGSYIQHQSYTIQKAYAPFNTKADRGGKKQKDSELPGPGSYHIEKLNINEKVVVSSANDDIKIVEVPKPQANFKSQTKRFTNNELKAKELLPGPGEYEQQDQLNKVLEKGKSQCLHLQKQNIIDKLMIMNKYQSTPSIPSKFHTFGYTENENNDLALNRMPGHQFSGSQKDSVGPGHYDLKNYIGTNKNKGNAWHKYQAPRMQNQLSKSTLNVGPGSYDVQSHSIPLYKMKQSPGFASQSLRSIENKKGAVANQLVKQRIAQSQHNSKNLQLEEESDDEEYIEDANPGPGHYHVESNQSCLKLSKNNSAGNFGSLSKRFSSASFSNPIGPGEYNPAVSGVIGKNPHEIKIRNPPFLSSDTRFQIKKIEEVKPGPGTYEPRINLEDKLIQKIQKGYRGNFGTTERRFKNGNVVDDQPGPGAYVDINTVKAEDLEANQPTSVFKSGSQRGIFSKKQEQRPPVGSYKLNYFDIEKKVNVEPEDPDIKINVPNLGFNTSQPRFKATEQKKGINDEDEEELSVIKDKRKEENKYQKENKHFISKAERFNYKDSQDGPSPGQYYDNTANPWNKRTFNIHFADF